MNRAKEILKSFYGYSDFRKGQEEIINEIINGNDVVALRETALGGVAITKTGIMLKKKVFGK